MKSGVDYGWYMVGGIVLLIVVFWKPISGGFQKITGGTARAESVAAGKVIFYDVERWGGKGSYKSCAMCHAADFKPDPTKKINMPDYRAGKPYELDNIAKRFGSVMTGDDTLFEQINNCLGQPARMGVGKVSSAAPFVKDLMAYVKTL